eukprot:1701718-Prymnesium_polylepis.1
MLSSARHRAARCRRHVTVPRALSTLGRFLQLDVLLRAPRSEFLRAGRASRCAQKNPSGVVAHALLRLGRAPAMDGCAGDPTFGSRLPPLAIRD